MMAYVCCVGSDEKFKNFHQKGLQRTWQKGDIHISVKSEISIFEAYNKALDNLPDKIDGVVFLHDDTEIIDPEFRSKIIHQFQDESVGIVGVVGACNVKSLLWLEYDTRGRVIENDKELLFQRGEFEVDMVDGLLMAMSPYIAHTLRFDQMSFRGFHGYDGDICFQTRVLGKKVKVIDTEVNHHTDRLTREPNRARRETDNLHIANYIFKKKWM